MVAAVQIFIFAAGIIIVIISGATVWALNFDRWSVNRKFKVTRLEREMGKN